MKNDLREQVARALTELTIRSARKWDTPPDELEAMLPKAIECSWRNELDRANAALAVMQSHYDARVKELEEALREVFEEWAGSEGFIPETAPEGYLLQLTKRMADIAIKPLGATRGRGCQHGSAGPCSVCGDMG